ncbi:MAG: phytanoyl-CoA dioxygenase family protein [Pseudomonadota bacterium]
MLSAADLRRCGRDGYLLVRKALTRAETAAFVAAVERIAALPPRPGREMLYYEDSKTEAGRRILSRIEKFADPGEPLAAFLSGGSLLALVESVLGEPAVLFKEKVNFKLPGGGGFEPHQDIQPGWDDYAPYFLSVAVALDEATAENGCLELAPGQHRRGWLGERWKPLTPQQTAGMRFAAVEMAPGDAVLFDCFVPHRSGPNLSGQPRRVLYATYNRARDGDHRERYFADKRASYPPDNEREPGKTYIYRV